MKTTTFSNAGEIDVRAISTFGVSVKEGDNPIGFFGTGLKYAIAVLLREGHVVTIYSGERVVEFGLSSETVRGQQFDFITMTNEDGVPQNIGFTTELGKKWEVWMAYREIACNCMDEAGTATMNDFLDPEAGTTRIVVAGDAFQAIHEKRGLYLLGSKPDFRSGTTEVHCRASNALFYRGVRVLELQKRALHTYNLTGAVELTEDRTIKSSWAAMRDVAVAILQCKDESFLRGVLMAPEDTMEHGLDYHGWGYAPSDEFLAVIGDCTLDRAMMVNPTARRVWQEHTKLAFAPREIGMTKVQLLCMERALDFCAKIGFQVRGSYPIKVCESLGEGYLGLAHENTIFIAERVFHSGGTKQLASTLIEEYLHLRHGWKDMTRELQTFLFDKLVSLGEELTGEPL